MRVWYRNYVKFGLYVCMFFSTIMLIVLLNNTSTVWSKISVWRINLQELTTLPSRKPMLSNHYCVVNYIQNMEINQKLKFQTFVWRVLDKTYKKWLHIVLYFEHWYQFSKYLIWTLSNINSQCSVDQGEHSHRIEFRKLFLGF